MNLELAAELCRRFEGYRAKPYLCPANVATIGYGSTYYADGRKVTLQALLSETVKASRNFCQVFVDRAIAKNLSRQAALKPDPLSVNVKVTIVPSTISLDTSKRL